jgi:hypothetical protein
LDSDIEEENIKSISKQKISKSFQMPSSRYPCIRGEAEAAPPILMCLELHLVWSDCRASVQSSGKIFRMMQEAQVRRSPRRRWRLPVTTLASPRRQMKGDIEGRRSVSVIIFVGVLPMTSFF